MAIPKEIKKFISEHHVLTLATIGDNGPQCSNLFYAYLAAEDMFVFTSSLTTEHSTNMANNSAVALSVVLETKVVGKIRGLQVKGEALQVTGDLKKEAKSCYLKKYPFAAVAPLELWGVRVISAKLTDNRLGFGKKILWNR